MSTHRYPGPHPRSRAKQVNGGRSASAGEAGREEHIPADIVVMATDLLVDFFAQIFVPPGILECCARMELGL